MANREPAPIGPGVNGTVALERGRQPDTQIGIDVLHVTGDDGRPGRDESGSAGTSEGTQAEHPLAAIVEAASSGQQPVGDESLDDPRRRWLGDTQRTSQFLE